MKTLAFKIISNPKRSLFHELLSIFLMLIVCIGIPIGIVFLPIKLYWVIIYLLFLLIVNKLLVTFKFKGKKTSDLYNESIIFNKESTILKLNNQEIVFSHELPLKLAMKYSGYENEIEWLPGNIFFNSGLRNKIEIISNKKKYVYSFLSTSSEDSNKLYIFLAKILPISVDCKLTIKGHLEYIRINGEMVDPEKYNKNWHW